MLSSEFNAEMGAMIRSLESQVRAHPELLNSDEHDVLYALDRLLVTIVSCRILMQERILDKDRPR